MSGAQKTIIGKVNQHFIAVVAFAVAAAVLIITWMGISQSRSDSFELLVSEGIAFTEALAQAAENAIRSENIIDHFVHLRYNEMVDELGTTGLLEPTNEQLQRLSRDHQIYGVFVFDEQVNLLAGTATQASVAEPPEFIYDEIRQLFEKPENNYTLILDEGTPPQPPLHYYLELTSTLDRVVLIVNDASYYKEAMRETQIGYLAQNMAREKGVEYIIFQTTEGIIFSSKKTGDLLAIESDPFLSAAIEANTVSYREYEFHDNKVLELVRPFSSPDFRFGLLRVGLSLDKYYAISRGFDLRMIIVAGVLLALVLTILLYLNSRRHREESELRYRRIKSVTDQILDQMRTGVVAINIQGVITLANTAFENIFSTSNTVGRNWSELVTASRLALERISPAGNRAAETEVTIRIDGRKCTLLVATSNYSSEGDVAEGTIVVVYDITRLKEFEQDSVRRARLSEMGQLAAGVAHEIRNPLNSISIAAQRLASEFTPTENQSEYQSIAASIRSETKRLDAIISRFLALAKSETKKIEPVALKEFFVKDARFLEMEAAQLGIELSIDIPEGLMIEADRASLMQVVTNLFNNSKEALSNNGGRIEIKAAAEDDNVVLSFSDNGPGIKDDIADEVFKPFFTTKDDGTGLGLPTVHRIVRELGGEIKLEHSQWGGARFVMYFRK